MADGLMTEQQMEHLLSMSGEDFDAEAIAFSGKLPVGQAAQLQAAIQANDMSRVNEIVRNAPSSIDPKDVQKMQAAVQKNDFVVKMVEVNRALNQLTLKQQSGAELNNAETTFLSQKKQIEAGNKKLEEYYPKAFGKEEPAKEGAEKSSDKAKGDFGFAGDWQFADPKDMEWLPIFEKSVFDPLKKIGGEKDIGDFVITLGTTILINMPLGFATEAINQRRTKNEEANKKAKENREAAIDNNLKNRGLTRNDLASQLAHEAKDWILNDPKYKNLPEHGPYTDYQKAMIEKRDFAAKLPRKPDGDLDWSKMDSKQQKKYAKYVTIYSQSPKWRNYLCEMCGVQIKAEEYEKQAKAAAQMMVANNVAADKASDGLDIPTAPEMPNLAEEAAMDTSRTSDVPSRHATPAPRGPAPHGSAPTGPAPATPPPHGPAPTGPAPVTPAPTLAPRGPAPAGSTSTSFATPAPVTPAPATPAPTGPAPVTPAPTLAPRGPAPAGSTSTSFATPAPTLAPPHSSEEAARSEAARQAIEEAHTPEQLEEIAVKGTAQNPVVITPDGKKVPYSSESLDEAKRKVDKLKREKIATDEAQANANQKMNALNRARTGAESTGNTQTSTRTHTGPTR